MTKEQTPQGRALLTEIEALVLRRAHAPDGKDGLSLHEIGRTLDRSENHLRRVLFNEAGGLTSWRIVRSLEWAAGRRRSPVYRASRLALVEQIQKLTGKST